jgi:predicted molibdopterin-dependent oxidoreductase YjgC
MWKRAVESGDTVTVLVNGRELVAHAGDTVAAAMLSAGLPACRETPVSGTPRGPYCMMGVCFECLVTIDGVASRQGCMELVAPGMRIETQHGKRRFCGS